jgi:parallel beta-helix repeat protein
VKRTIWCSYVGLLLVGMLASPVVAQSNETPTETPAATNTSAADLKITPRFGVGHTSSGAGFDGFTRFSGFVPLLQNPGNNLTFLDGRFFLDNSANGGGNILLGHRFYSQQANRLFGGYIAYDTRDTGNSVFHQLGVGLESLGEVWDVHLNGYIPIGDRRQVVDENFINTDFQLTNSFFEDHFLITQGRRQGRVIRHQEAAMTGLDLEIGAKLAQLGDQGDLRGYGGLYLYDASGSPEILGWRLRLEARPSETLNLGLSVQDDYLFGTNVVFTIGATFPGTRPSGVSNPESVLARMGESVVRTANITVDSQQELDSFNEAFTAKAINPETGEPYFFQHVELGSTGGNGTFENPFGQVRDALSVAQTDQIVYVQFGTNPGIMGGVNFVIPDGVSVLSTGPVQEINTVNLGLVQLPLSGTGRLPDVMDTVTMGNNTTLSGFAITSANGFGIDASDVTNVVIRDNQVTNSRERGISLENVTGGAVITNNSITDVMGILEPFPFPFPISFASGQGILVRNNSGKIDLTITDNQLEDNNVSGIVVEASGDAHQTFTLSSNAISNSDEVNDDIIVIGDDIEVDASNNATQEFILRNNIISQGDSISISASDAVTQDFVLSDNSILNNSGSISISATNDVTQKFTLSDNTITNGSGSINISATNDVIQKFTLSDNTITNGSGSINVDASDNVTQEFALTGNTISNSRGDMRINASDNVTQKFTIMANLISNSYGYVNQPFMLGSFRSSIDISANGDATQEFTLSGNTIRDIDFDNNFAPMSGSAIRINADEDATQNFILAKNTISNISFNFGGSLAINADMNSVQYFTVSENTISNTSGFNDSSISINSRENASQEFRFSNNNINDIGHQAISISATDETTQKFTLSGNTISNTNLSSFSQFSLSSISVSASKEANQEFTFSGNTIRDIEGFSSLSGVSVNASENANQKFTVSGNTISNIFRTNLPGDLILVNGISINASGNTNQYFTLSNNNISNSSGIFIGNLDNGDIAAEVRLNTITDSDSFGFIARMNSTETFCLDLSNNTSETGFLLINFLGTFELLNLTDIPAKNTGAIFVFPDIGSFESVPDCL